MKRNLCGRLERLEEIKEAADRAKTALAPRSGPSVADILRERLRLKGFVPTDNESLADTMARAFGMTPRELRQLMAGPAEAFNAKLQSL